MRHQPLLTGNNSFGSNQNKHAVEGCEQPVSMPLELQAGKKPKGSERHSGDPPGRRRKPHIRGI
ncbi:hypothetical protein [Serratia fonticola]|uniref:hypothetical protein n=1 Tax=Serratia fonticola TaxID=47917 RepID=UPI0013152E5A|nr:hypothetical protein [Serratia fonticola]